MKRIAWIISRIFEPIWEVPLIVGMAVWYSTPPELHIKLLIILLFTDVIIPGFFLAYLLLRKKVADWDFTNRQEREKAYIFTVIFHLIGAGVMFALNQLLLGKILLLLWVITFVFMLINRSWKISVHAGVNALLMVFLNSLFGWKMFGWMSVMLILVLWSRVKIRKHTVTQVMIGAALAMAIAELGLRILDII